MTCTSCQNANPDGATFCMSCGTALSNACPQCGTGLPGGAKFCLQCGHQLAESESGTVQAALQQYIPKQLLSKLQAAQAMGGMQDERRIVTMLFCDVAGSTAAAGQLDPEEWAEIMNGAFEYLIAPVYRYEGTLARLMGDAILAFFGAPVAHEDDPQRAVMAGLEIVQGIDPYWEEVRSKWKLDCEVRVGINTGLVVVGEVGSDLRMEYTAMGDAINIAARMEQTAKPGTIQVSADTHRLVAPLFDFEDLGPIEVKGKSEPVQAYRVLQPKADPGSLRGIEGLDAPLIGREHEMDTLRGLIAGLRQGEGKIVSVIGDAGLGKSRLIAEMRDALVSDGVLAESNGRSSNGAGIGEAVSWHEARSVSYATSSPYAPFVGLLSGYFDLRPDDTEQGKYQKIRSRMGDLLSERVGATAPFVATLLGISLEGEDLKLVRYLKPPQIRERTFGAVRSLVEGMAATQLLVLILEDLHWADPTSIELIEHLMSLTDSLALMILAMFRPQRQDLSWRYHEVAARDYVHRYTSIELQPLDESGSRELVASLLHVEGLPESVRSLILTKAEGNPFFVEEVIRSLLDSHLVVREDGLWRATGAIEGIAVPDTLAGVINARLDRLEDESKRVVQTAAVIGREFDYDTLSDIYGALGSSAARAHPPEKWDAAAGLYVQTRTDPGDSLRLAASQHST